MGAFDSELKDLWYHLSRRQKMEAELAELRKQRDTLAPRVETLRRESIREQKDVKRLEGWSLSSLYYSVTGQLDEKLELEREEAAQAKERLDFPARKLEEIENSIQEKEKYFSSLPDYEKRYHILLSDRRGALENSGGAVWEDIRAKEISISFLEEQKHKLKEALAQGHKTHRLVRNLNDYLSSAQNWNVQDAISEGVAVDIIKRDKFNHVNTELRALQDQILCFEKALEQASISAQISPVDMQRLTGWGMESFLNYAAAKDRIQKTIPQVEKTEKQTARLIAQIQSLLETNQRKIAKAQAEWEKMIVNA